MTRFPIFVALAALSAALVACGASGGPGGADTVALRGAVFSDHLMDQLCEAQAANSMRPDSLAGIRLTFTGAGGAVLGTAVTGPLQWQDLDYGCRFYAEYAVDLPEAAEFRVAFEPVPPVRPDGYFSGAEDLVPMSITRQQLAANDNTWSFEAMPTYVVP